MAKYAVSRLNPPNYGTDQSLLRDWRLSQGDQSRIFLACALLQKAEIVVLDESLAARDPENLRKCLDCIMRQAPTLIRIAHP
jgi:ATP-binding cassette subfamily B protein